MTSVGQSEIPTSLPADWSKKWEGDLNQPSRDFPWGFPNLSHRGEGPQSLEGASNLEQWKLGNWNQTKEPLPEVSWEWVSLLFFCFPCSCYGLVMRANKFTFLCKRFLSHVIRRVLNNICSLYLKIMSFHLSVFTVSLVFLAVRCRFLQLVHSLSSPSCGCDCSAAFCNQ